MRESTKQITSEKICNEIKEKIYRREYLPGEHLVETELMETFQCSRATIREALKLLCGDGLAVHKANKGITIRKLSLDEIVEINEVLQSLESQAIYLLASRKDKRALADIEAILAEFESAVNNSNVFLTGKLYVDLNEKIAESCGNEIIFNLIKKYYLIVVSSYGIIGSWSSEHKARSLVQVQLFKEILEKIKQGDASGAALLHYKQCGNNLLQIKIDKFGY